MATKQTYRLDRTVENPKWDRRCKHGLAAQASFKEGMLWFRSVPTDEHVRKLAWVPEKLTPEQEQQYVDEIRERFVVYHTPWGSVDDDKVKQLLQENSTPSFPFNAHELVYLRRMEWVEGAQVLDHLRKKHGWSMEDIDQVLAEIDQESVDAAAAAA